MHDFTTFSLRYQIGPNEYLAKERLLNGDTLAQASRSVWRDTLLFAATCFLGLVASLKAESVLLGLAFGTVLLARLTVAWEFKSNFNASMNALVDRKVRRRDVSLTVDAEGVHEEVEGVRSFAPWSAVKAVTKMEDVVFLELAGQMWAVIPTVAFLGAGAPSETEFIEMLQSKGVPWRSQDDERLRKP